MSLQLERLGLKIHNKWVLRNLNLSVNDGEFLALLGPSGCGKSTTLRLIAGLDNPNEGSIYISGKDVTNLSPVNRKIGMVFQSYALYPHLSVKNNLLLGLKVRGVDPSEQKIRLENILNLMKLENFIDSFPSELSGGQRQRVALARALLRDPKVFLLDEPMSNLDSQLRENLRPELKQLILKDNQPVVYVTHDQQEAMGMADKIAVLNNGLLEQVGSPKDLYNKPQTIFVAKFIGRPQINLIEKSQGVVNGVRPEDLFFGVTGAEGKLIHKEWFGNNQLLVFETNLGNLRMLTKPDINIPNDIKIDWDLAKEHKFSTKTGYRLN